MIGYLSILELKDTFAGGILVVDEHGIPKEFKYTEPITPTKLQKIIYGKSLKRFITIEVISKNLISKLNEKPILILTDNMELIETGESVFFITKIFEEAQEEKDTEKGEYILKSPTSIYRIVGNSELNSEVLEKLHEVASNIDLLEPFERLKAALEYICENSSRK